MSERYIKIFTTDENLYLDGAPIVIRAGALLKDTQFGKIIAQLKFRNVSGKSISYVKVAITPFDAIKTRLSEAISFEYLDVAVMDNEEFGSKNPITIPNASTRSFFVGVSHVGFADGSVWESDNTDWKAAQSNSKILTVLAVGDTYKKAVELSKSKKKEDLETAKELFESIQAEKDVSLEISACDENIEKINAVQLQKKQKKKKAKTTTAIIAIACIVSLVGYFVAYPFIACMNGDYAVYIDMYNVKDFKVPNGAKSIGYETFNSCESLASVTIPSSVTSIGEGAFANCSSLTSVTIPSSVTNIGRSAFYHCNSLTSITIPNSVTSIDDHAFWYCFNLTNVTIPNSVTSIGSTVFASCDSLTAITFNGTIKQWHTISKAGTFDNKTVIVHCTDGDISTYPDVSNP